MIDTQGMCTAVTDSACRGGGGEQPTSTCIVYSITYQPTNIFPFPNWFLSFFFSLCLSSHGSKGFPDCPVHASPSLYKTNTHEARRFLRWKVLCFSRWWDPPLPLHSIHPSILPFQQTNTPLPYGYSKKDLLSFVMVVYSIQCEELNLLAPMLF